MEQISRRYFPLKLGLPAKITWPYIDLSAHFQQYLFLPLWWNKLVRSNYLPKQRRKKAHQLISIYIILSTASPESQCHSLSFWLEFLSFRILLSLVPSELPKLKAQYILQWISYSLASTSLQFDLKSNLCCIMQLFITRPFFSLLFWWSCSRSTEIHDIHRSPLMLRWSHISALLENHSSFSIKSPVYIPFTPFDFLKVAE